MGGKGATARIRARKTPYRLRARPSRTRVHELEQRDASCNLGWAVTYQHPFRPQQERLDGDCGTVNGVRGFLAPSVDFDLYQTACRLPDG